MTSSAIGPVAEAIDGVGGLAERHRLAAVQRDRNLLVGDPHFALGHDAGHGEILQLAAIGRLRNAEHRLLRQRLAFGIGARRHREAEKHRHRPAVHARRRIAPPVLEVALLAGAGIEQRPETIRSLGRGRRRHPRLPEEAVSELELLLALEGKVGEGMGEGVAIGCGLGGRGPGRHALEAFRAR